MMLKLDNRTVFDDGTVICNVDAAVELLYSGKSLSQAIFQPDEEIQLYNVSNEIMDCNLDPLLISNEQCFNDYQWYRHWNTLEPWSSMSVLDYCIEKCATDDERIRVCEEYKLFDERDMIPVLKHLIWMVQNFRERGIFWGVGRGSSVSSYILYLIGINRINPMQFDLDIKEFLK